MNKKLASYIKNKFMKVAEDLVVNPSGLKIRIVKAREKLAKESVKESLGIYVEELNLFMRMISSAITKKYTGLSKESAIYIVVAVIYFVTPTDFVPDFLLGLGFIDDRAVIAWVMDKIQKDKEDFKKWESS